ncbi:DDB1- and CUL4-associated factor 12 [Borealophlyctis nickersoniae]|nr:DDB1- and CUL4-associated factor 12 [Borealophlyctis nickersoniae]
MPDHNHCSGVHSIAINPSRTLIAIGAGEPTEYIQVYRLPTFDPHAVLTGHMDMVFSVAWIDDHTLISGSRDTSVKMWRVAPSDSITSSSPTPFHPIISTLPTLSGTPISIIPPVLSRQSHRSKVRDLQFNPHANRSAAAATLSTDGTVKIWDVSTLTVADSIPLFHTNETVCLALDAAAGTYAVGSQCHISFVDPRVAAVVASVDSVDEGWGVRSLSIDNGVMTVGGGLGRLSFFDVRAQRYIGWEHQDADKRNFGNPLNHGTPAKDGSPIQYLAVGAGWLQHDQVYMNHFQGLEVRNAVYTLSYDRTGTRLFAAGGPLQLNLRGCYAGLW